MQLTIQDVAFGGKGVGRSEEGLAVFVPFTLPGESVEAEITRRRKNYAEADLGSVLAPSPDRVEPPCPYFGRCGGCAYQHATYPAQLAIKARQVEQTLRRVGRLAEVPMRQAVASPLPYGYRNRIRVHVAGGVVGFYAFGANALVDIERCQIASEEVNARLAELRARVPREGDYTLAERRGGAYFEQTNDAVARALLAVVEEALTPGGRLVDAYCGAGFFSHQMRERFDEVIGIEENEFAVAHARSLATPRERYFAGDVAVHLPDALGSLATAATTSLILDPPAAGVSARVLDTILAAMPREIVYVSCNPATLARDLAALSRAYRLHAVTPLDMFAQTAEIEVVAHLRRP